MIERHGVHGAEVVQVVLVRRIVAVPSHHVEGRVRHGGMEHGAAVLRAKERGAKRKGAWTVMAIDKR